MDNQPLERDYLTEWREMNHRHEQKFQQWLDSYYQNPQQELNRQQQQQQQQWLEEARQQ
ncbi:hypothetical protein HC928_11030 [bacterium]|nr:hypothetical protein [bacterium]